MIKPLKLVLTVVSIGVVTTAWATEFKPQRIVSLGHCTDQLLLMLVERERIASLTYTATDAEVSYMASLADNIPQNNGNVEQIISYQPDLVVGSFYASWNSVRILRLLGYEVKLITLPHSIEGARQYMREFAAWVGETQKAENLIAAMDWQLNQARIRNQHKAEKSVMVYSPNGYTIGADTLEDDLFRYAGYRNLSAELGLKGFQKISLEHLVAAKPDYLQIDNHMYNANSRASAYIHHPVLEHMVSPENHLFVPSRLRDCGAAPMVAEAVSYLADKR